MSSRADAKRWMKFCKHMREAIIDEQKAVPDYAELIKQGNSVLTTGDTRARLRDVVSEIMEDEKRHKADLLPLFNWLCPRTAFHRKGILKAMGGEEIDPSQYGAVITSEGIYRPRQRKRR